MRQELETALTAARELPAPELPRLLGELEEIRATALARLSSPAGLQVLDELLDVEQAAARLGSRRLICTRIIPACPLSAAWVQRCASVRQDSPITSAHARLGNIPLDELTP